jgi:hypothetical protein
MRLRHRLDVMAIEHRAIPLDGLGRIVVGDIANEFHGHSQLLVRAYCASTVRPSMKWNFECESERRVSLQDRIVTRSNDFASFVDSNWIRRLLSAWFTGIHAYPHDNVLS